MSNAQIIVALDLDNVDRLDELLNLLQPSECNVKVGIALYIARGPDFVRMLVTKGFKVFLDLKLHDVPSQVGNAVQQAEKLGVWMLSLHALGSEEMMRAARLAASSTLLVAVTVLTSHDSASLPKIGLEPDSERNVSRLAWLAQQSGMDGVVCSAQEANLVRTQCGPSFLIVTPGIRINSETVHDQKRVMSPEEAVVLGSNYLVIGRPITGAADPIAVLKRIRSCM
jgi:orotidine-5'-phosphate decarboxylase